MKFVRVVFWMPVLENVVNMVKDWLNNVFIICFLGNKTLCRLCHLNLAAIRVKCHFPTFLNTGHISVNHTISYFQGKKQKYVQNQNTFHTVVRQRSIAQDILHLLDCLHKLIAMNKIED